MLATLQHRGPDGEGKWDNHAGLYFGHRRLAIIDLSEHGHQPMVSPSGRYTITYNGEIYNFQALRTELSSLGHSFRGHSDTEILLAAFDNWGIRGALEKVTGMFALGIWDKHNNSLTLARDRAGEKPLYYGHTSDGFVFASELKPIKKFSPSLEIQRDALALYFRHNYIPAPWSIYQGIYKLPPASFVTFTQADLTQRHLPSPETYWQLAHHSRQPLDLSEAEAVRQLDQLIANSVQKQMVADVPLGVFLSGGIDSSTITAVMQKLSTEPVKSFSIGFNDPQLNEAEYAREIANHLGTDHTEMYVDGSMCLDTVEKIPRIYDEPFSDSSQIPTYIVSKLARSQVTVCLSGDGGDELFGGYNRYFLTEQYWPKIQRIPLWMRRGFKAVMNSSPPWLVNGSFAVVRPLMPKNLRFDVPYDKLKKASMTLQSTSIRDFYKDVVSHHRTPDSFVINAREPSTLLDSFQANNLANVEQLMAIDFMTYLPGDILTKVDRASMAVSLECRVPLLDHKIIEFAQRLPLGLKVKGGQGKYLLRQVLDQYVPKNLIDRPKKGFGVPLAQWMRQDLKDLCGDMFAREKLARENFIDADQVQLWFSEHISGKRNWQYQLWDVLMFELWLDSQ